MLNDTALPVKELAYPSFAVTQVFLLSTLLRVSGDVRLRENGRLRGLGSALIASAFDESELEVELSLLESFKVPR